MIPVLIKKKKRLIREFVCDYSHDDTVTKTRESNKGIVGEILS